MAGKIKKGKQQESILRPTVKTVEVYPLHQISICDYNGRYRYFSNLGMADAILSHNGSSATAHLGHINRLPPEKNSVEVCS
jgi:hypothetical protein